MVSMCRAMVSTVKPWSGRSSPPLASTKIRKCCAYPGNRGAGCARTTLAPRPVPQDLFRKLPAPSGSRREPVEQSREFASDTRQVSLPLAVPARPPARIEPVAPELHVMRVTVGSDFKADLEAVRDELSHKLPGASLEAVLHECIRVTLEACRKRRRGAGKKTTWNLPPVGSRDYPSAVKHAVWTRDKGKCTYVGPTGHRCNSTYQVQVHHIHPHEMGGPPTVENLTLRCRAHNLYAPSRTTARSTLRRRSPAADPRHVSATRPRRCVEDSRHGSTRSGHPWQGQRLRAGDHGRRPPDRGR
jgi:5-methylcytosine-specific restriction endonuclease McrA